MPAQLKLYVFAIQYVLFGALMAGFILFEPGGLVSLGRRRSNRAATRTDRPRSDARLRSDARARSLGPERGLWRHGAGRGRALLRIPRGSIVALLGANGAGKTTTLRAIGGLLPTEPARIVRGHIRLDGESIAGWPPDRVARAGVARCPNATRSSARSASSRTWPSRAAYPGMRELVLRHFPILHERRRVLAGYLSGGERQMLALACALLCAPKLLLVDELSLGLAPALVQQLMHTLGELRRELGLTVLLVEQNAAAALDSPDHAYLLANGRVVKHGPASALRADPDVQSVYLGMHHARRSYRVSAP